MLYFVTPVPYTDIKNQIVIHIPVNWEKGWGAGGNIFFEKWILLSYGPMLGLQDSPRIPVLPSRDACNDKAGDFTCAEHGDATAIATEMLLPLVLLDGLGH
jgi:hypothetical protein